MTSNEKGDNEEVEGSMRDVSRANWNRETIHIFCDLCIQHAEKSKGKRGATTSQRMPWKVLEVERAFGILKARWKILGQMPKYSLEDQNRIVCASFALHNYIRLSKVPDPAFKIVDKDPTFIPPEASRESDCSSMQEAQRLSTNEMSKIRDDITTSLMRRRRRQRAS